MKIPFLQDQIFANSNLMEYTMQIQAINVCVLYLLSRQAQFGVRPHQIKYPCLYLKLSMMSYRLADQIYSGPLEHAYRKQLSLRFHTTNECLNHEYKCIKDSVC